MVNSKEKYTARSITLMAKKFGWSDPLYPFIEFIPKPIVYNQEDIINVLQKYMTAYYEEGVKVVISYKVVPNSSVRTFRCLDDNCIDMGLVFENGLIIDMVKVVVETDNEGRTKKKLSIFGMMHKHNNEVIENWETDIDINYVRDNPLGFGGEGL